MSFRVVVFDSATDDLVAAHTYLSGHAPRTVLKWLERFQKALEELAVTAPIYPRADEARISKLPLQQMLFGKKPHVFRVIFIIDGLEVQVLRVIRGQRQRLTRKQIEESRHTRPTDEGGSSESS